MHSILLLLQFIYSIFFFPSEPSNNIQFSLNSLNFLNPPIANAATFTISGQVSAQGGGTQFGNATIQILLSGPASGNHLTGGTGGTYSFTNLPAGSYIVHMVVPAGLHALTAVTVSTTVG